MKKIFSLVTVALLVSVDQLIKIIIDLWLKPIQFFPLIQNVVAFTYVENRGVAFGMLQNQRWLFTTVTAAVIVFGFYCLLSGKIKSNYILTTAILILSGGLGNLIDRVFRGYVIDYIEPLFIRFAVFNFADILVTAGAFLLIGWLICSGVHDARQQKQRRPASKDLENDE